MKEVVLALAFLFLKTGEKFATPETAGPTVAAFTAEVGKPLGVTFAPRVLNDPAKAIEYCTKKKPPVGIVTPGFYLAYGKVLGMEPLLETRRTGVPVERFVLVMRKDAGDGIEAAAGKVVATTLTSEERYVIGVIFQDKLGEVRLKAVTDAEGAAFDVLEKGDAVLLEEGTWTALAKDEELGAKLKVVYRSDELLGPLVVTFGKHALDREKLKAALTGLKAETLASVRVEKFVAVEADRLQKAEARFHGR